MHFSGTFELKLDTKSRLILPAKVKAKLPEGTDNVFYLVKGSDPCIELYPRPAWEKNFEIINQLSGLGSSVNRSIQRRFFSQSSEVEMDNQARILIPKSLIEFASLKSDIVLLGVGDRLEIWDPKLLHESEFLGPKGLEFDAQTLNSIKAASQDNSGVIVNIVKPNQS